MVAPAGYGQFTGYEPAANGGYMFQRANGSPLLFAGAPADELKARIDAYNSVNQPQVAGPGGGAPGGGGAGAYGDEGNAPPSPAEIQTLREQLTQPASAVTPAVAAPAQAGPGGNLGYGMRVTPDGRIQKYTPGSAGVSQEQLQKKAGTGTVLPTGVSETVQGAIPASQEYLEARAQANIDQRLLLDKERQTALEAAEAESKLAEQQFNNSMKLQSEEQARIADLQKRVSADERLRDKAYADFSSSKVDPQRIYSGKGGGANRVLAALSSGLGAMGAALARTPNFAQQIIDSTMDRDIASQEAAIRIKGDAANNALQTLQRSGMSLDQAKSALKGIQVQHQRAELEQLRARNAIPALQNNYDKLDLALQNSLLEANEAYRRDSIGKTVRTTQSTVAYPQAGSAGGFVDVGDQLGTAQKVQNLRKGEVEIAKDQAAAAKGPTASPELRKVDQSLAGLASDQERLKQYGDNEKPLTEANRAGVVRSGMKALDEVVGQGTWQDWFYSNRDKNFVQDFEGAKGNLTAAVSVANQQGAMQEGERKEAERKIAAAGTVGELKRAQAWVRDRLERQREAAAATPGPNVEITK